MVFINHTELLDGRVAIVEINGPLNSTTSPDFEEYINKLLERKLHFILFDARNLEYVSSEGIGLTLLLQRMISEANGFFVIFNLKKEIDSLFSLLGFDKVFRIAASRAEALQIIDRQMELRDGGIELPAEKAELDIEIKHDAPAPEEKPAVDHKTEEVPDSAYVIECQQCKSLMRVREKGEYLCPQCNSQISFSGDDAVKKTPAAVNTNRAEAEFAPFVVECARCKSLIRVKNKGDYQCPDCHADFTILEDQTVIF